MKIGFIGTGILGSAIVKKLLSHGLYVNVYNRSSHKAEALSQFGANVCFSISKLLHDSQVIFFCLSNEDATYQILKSDFSQDKSSGKTIIDLCTASTDYAKEVAFKLKFMGAGYIECPVSGGVVGAMNGTLTAICAGDRVIFDAHKYILKYFCKHIHYTGCYGNAQQLKIINNLAESINMLCAAEVITIARNLGFNIDIIRDVLTTARGKSDYMTILLDNIYSHDKNVAVTLDVRLKDLKLAMNLIQDTGINPVFSECANTLFTETLNIYGKSEDQSKCLEIVKNKMLSGN